MPRDPRVREDDGNCYFLALAARHSMPSVPPVVPVPVCVPVPDQDADIASEAWQSPGLKRFGNRGIAAWASSPRNARH
jgi:hypothetical protein